MIYAIQCTEHNGNTFTISSLDSDVVVTFKDGHIEADPPLSDLFAHLSHGDVLTLTMFNIEHDDGEGNVMRRHVTVRADAIVEAVAVPMDAP